MDNRLNPAKLFAIRHPFLFALTFFAISVSVDIGIIMLRRTLVGVAYVGAGVFDFVLQALFALGVLLWLGWLRSAGLNGPSQWRNLQLLWLPALLALPYLVSSFTTPISHAEVVLFALLYALLVAINEEARFHGVILQALLPYGPLQGAILCGVFFGLLHLDNLLVGGLGLLTLAQVIGAFLLGFGFAALRLRTNTLWPLIIFHVLYDLPAIIGLFNAKNFVVGGLTVSPTIAIIGLIVPSLLLASYGLFLLRTGRSQGAKREAME